MTTDRYPPGGCILRDKQTCSLPYATCCDEGRSQRWPRCNCPLGCNAPTQQSPAECPYHARAGRFAAESTKEA